MSQRRYPLWEPLTPSLFHHLRYEYGNDIFGDFAILRFSTPTNADCSYNLSVDKKRIASGNESYARVVGLYCHKRLPFGLSLIHI